MDKLLQLAAQYAILEEGKRYIDYLETGFYEDFRRASVRAVAAYGEKTDDMLTQDGKALREFITDFDDRRLGVVAHMIAAMVYKLSK